MINNEVTTAINEQIEQIEIKEDKADTLTVRTRESLKQAFKSIDAKTDNDKLIKLLELYSKFQATQDKFNVDSNIDVIDKAMATITSQIKAITSSVNQYERTLNEKYIVDIADDMKLLKEQIENEEILNAKIIKLEKELELLTKRYEEKEQIVFQSIDKIKNIEEENKKYIALNSELVSKENNYINQLRAKDTEISSKGLEISKLTREHESKINALESEYKANLEQLNVNNKEIIKELENKLVGADKEKAILESNIGALETQNAEYKANIETMRKEYRADIKSMEKEFKTDIKELEKANKELVLDKAKLESKSENLEDNINTLKEQIELLLEENRALKEELSNLKLELLRRNRYVKS